VFQGGSAHESNSALLWTVQPVGDSALLGGIRSFSPPESVKVGLAHEHNSACGDTKGNSAPQE